jgi:hypothetical protein
MKMQAAAYQAQGKEQAAAALQDLERTLGSIRALTAQRGIDPSSPSATAYSEGVASDAYRSVYNTRANAEAQARALRRSASASLFGGWAAAGSSFTKAASMAWDQIPSGAAAGGGA